MIDTKQVRKLNKTFRQAHINSTDLTKSQVMQAIKIANRNKDYRYTLESYMRYLYGLLAELQNDK